jgi:hypothetical protein
MQTGAGEKSCAKEKEGKLDIKRRNTEMQEYKTNPKPITSMNYQLSTINYFAKRTQFRDLQSLLLRCNISHRHRRYPIILKSLGSWVLRFLVFSKQTQSCWRLVAGSWELFAKRTQIPLCFSVSSAAKIQNEPNSTNL